MSNSLSVLVNKFATRYEMGDEQAEVTAILKQTCFKGQVSDAQMVALLLVADAYGLNPFLKELYAFPDKQNGIVPVVGVDGWSRIINQNPQFDGMEFEMAADGSECTCKIYRKDRSHAVSTTEYFSECRRQTGPWQSHPKRMLRHKAMIQCARLAFGFAGIYDQDEAERIVEGAKGVPAGYELKESAEADAFETEHGQTLRDAAMDGKEALQQAFAAIPSSKGKAEWWKLHSTGLKAAAEAATVIESAVDTETGEVMP